MTEKEKMLSGQLYIPSDSEELAKDARKARQLTRQINNTTEEETVHRYQLFKQLFKEIGEGFWIEPPFLCDYGCHTSIGDNFYANFDCIIIDVCDVTIGNNVFFGPRVCVYTAAHPIDAEVRSMLLEYGRKVKIGNNVWVGGNTVINPGVTIGDNTVVGSGSVVTRDIPPGVVAAGNPCRVLRQVTERDQEYWQKEAQRYFGLKG